MFLSAVSFAKSKSKTLLVRMVSQAGTGITFNARRGRLREKLTLLHYDPVATWMELENVMLTETNQTQEDKYQMFSCMESSKSTCASTK
ncbi:39S ribosomal protein L33, mitochondrial isoform X1 [Heterocephalus glaber]|uniref:39S ribosomal protein L33, mitochondrial isoform X1 n=1 Tax=Heterocephalus glaber TaxID=10181 RepID=A0AAX6NXM5_HETGA|nr:39S ribosomal protein L33, mitochondrial isoform X1 [Heterocephalus glaber]